VAGLQIELEPGWKTYWRTPGDGGGMPPEGDWVQSKNLADAKLLFPAPHRLRDPQGDSIGYKDEVVFPILLTPIKSGQPIDLRVSFAFGVCREICIPEDTNLHLHISMASASDISMASASDASAPILQAALGAVPRKPDGGGRDPSVVSLSADLDAKTPVLAITARFPAGASGADAFIESVDEAYVPLPQIMPDTGDGLVRFRVDLSKTDNPKALLGRQLRLTLVSDAAQSETSLPFPTNK
jgi:DsbC/DsbD-like thiol-disulfide interchange protein